MANNVNIPQILIFGTNKCKFCLKQIDYLKETYGKSSSKWMYINLSKNNNMIKIAKDMNIETIPSVVLLSQDNRIIFTRKGTISPDEIFDKLYNCSSQDIKLRSLPFPLKKVSYIKKIQDGRKALRMFSSGFQLKQGDTAIAATYDNETIRLVKINSITKMTMEQIQQNHRSENVDEYLMKGGNKTHAWMINFQPQNEN